MRLVFCLVLSTAAVSVLPLPARAQDATALVKQLESNDQATRLAALEELAEHPTKPKVALEGIAKAFNHADPLTRAAAINAAAAYGPRAKGAVPRLIKMLSAEKEPAVRASAARALGVLGDKSGPEVDVLIGAITDADPRVRRAAISAIRRLQPGPERTMPKFVEVLTDADPGAVVAALASIADFGAAAVGPMTTALANEDASYWALVVLGDIGPEAKDAVPQIKALLTSEEPEVRMQAALTLGEIGPGAASAAPDLIAALDDKEEGVQYAVIYALARIGDPSAKDGLAELESSDDPLLSLLSVWAQAEIDPENKEAQQEAFDALSAAIAGDNLAARRAAAHALVSPQAANPKVVPLLIKALADEDDVVSRNAGDSFLRMGAAAAEPLAGLLKDPQERPKAAFLLSILGPDAKAAVPALLVAVTEEQDPDVRRMILMALGQAGVEDPAAVAKLVPLLKDENVRVKRGATYVLGKMGPAAKSAVGPIQANLSSDDPDTRLITVWALLQIAPQDKSMVAKAVPQLISALTHELELARVEAATALGNLGAAAKTALPALKELLEYDTAAVRAAVEEAIKKIEAAG